MKSLKPLVTFLVLMSVVTACNKKEAITNVPVNNELNTISLNYLNALSSSNGQDQPMIFGIHLSKKALRIIGADLGGALTGAAIAGVGPEQGPLQVD